MGFFSDIGDMLFHGNEGPYEQAQEQYGQYMGQAAGQMRPYAEFGQRGMPQYESWLGGMQDPSKFINSLMGGYQESPYAKYLQQQGMQGASNAASASGLLGSSPFMRESARVSEQIASGDLENWLSKVLGINTEYGQGLQNQISTGSGAASNLSNLYSDQASGSAELSFGRGMGRQADLQNILGMVTGFAPGFQQGWGQGLSGLR